MSVDSFFTRLNPLLRWLLRSRLHFLASGGLMLLTVTGRRSGRRFSFPVGYQRESGGALTVMVSEARKKQWWRNLREPAPVEILLRGRPRSGKGELVEPGSELFFDCVEQTMRRVPGMARVFRVKYDRAAGLSEAQRAHLRDEVAAVRIVLDAA